MPAETVTSMPAIVVNLEPKRCSRASLDRCPAITLFTDFARNGGLLAYGPNLLTLVRQQGVLAAKVLQGSKPAETPIEAPTKFEFVLNLRAAEMLGITVPASTLLRADEVID